MKKTSFTVIELLVVIAIIGLLAAIIVISVSSAKERANDSRRATDIKAIHNAMEMCFVDSECEGGEYPVWSAGASLAGQTIAKDGSPLYLAIPQDPLGSGDQTYKYLGGDKDHYCIAVKLEVPAEATWFCASNQGTFLKAGTFSCAPSNVPCPADCCGVNIFP